MANFVASQSISTIGLCQKIRSTDTSPYGNNDELIGVESILKKNWVFRNASGTVIKSFEGGKNDQYCECDISLLTLNISVELTVSIEVRGAYSVSNSFLIPCLGI